jgi:hypothetical protein
VKVLTPNDRANLTNTTTAPPPFEWKLAATTSLLLNNLPDKPGY